MIHIATVIELVDYKIYQLCTKMELYSMWSTYGALVSSNTLECQRNCLGRHLAILQLLMENCWVTYIHDWYIFIQQAELR